jgi:hypothetical protein
MQAKEIESGKIKAEKSNSFFYKIKRAPVLAEPVGHSGLLFWLD